MQYTTQQLHERIESFDTRARYINMSTQNNRQTAWANAATIQTRLQKEWSLSYRSRIRKELKTI